MKLAVVTRNVQTPLISACMGYLSSVVELDDSADVLLSVQYDRILPITELSRYKMAFNLHNAKLPEYCGHHCINWAIANRETTYTSTLIWMAEEVDAGAIAYERETPILLGDTPEDLYFRTIGACVRLMQDLVRDLSCDCEIPVRPQAGVRRYYRKGYYP